MQLSTQSQPEKDIRSVLVVSYIAQGKRCAESEGQVSGELDFLSHTQKNTTRLPQMQRQTCGLSPSLGAISRVQPAGRFGPWSCYAVAM